MDYSRSVFKIFPKGLTDLVLQCCSISIQGQRILSVFLIMCSAEVANNLNP